MIMKIKKLKRINTIKNKVIMIKQTSLKQKEQGIKQCINLKLRLSILSFKTVGKLWVGMMIND